MNQLLYVFLSVFSGTNEWTHRYLERMKEITPKPCLVPTVAFYRHPVEGLKFRIELRLPIEISAAYLWTDFSNCAMFCSVGANNYVAGFNLENRCRLKWLRGHENIVSVVKFSSDASKLISGSLDNSVIIWD